MLSACPHRLPRARPRLIIEPASDHDIVIRMTFADGTHATIHVLQSLRESHLYTPGVIVLPASIIVERGDHTYTAVDLGPSREAERNP
jgi:hypothetical protein